MVNFLNLQAQRVDNKLLSINTYHYRRGGSDTVFFDHDAMFNEIGWDTAVFCMQHPMNEPTRWDKYFVDEIEFGHSYPLHKKIAMARNVVYSFEARRKLRAMLKDFRPNIVHVHNLYHHISPSILPLLHNEGIPVVMTAHDLKLACPAYKMYIRTGLCERCRTGNILNVIQYNCVRNSRAASLLVAAETLVHRTLDIYRKHLNRIIVPSKFFARKLAEWGWPEEMLVHIPNAIDTNKYKSNISPGAYFLYFGRLAAEKGLFSLIKSAAKSGIKLRLAGIGPSENALRRLAHDLEADVDFLGFQTGDSLWRLVQGARAIVLPSEWYENAPMSILEAYASGKPVIGADIGGIPELIIPGQTGTTFSSGDSDSLADALARMNRLPNNAVMEMGAAALAHVQAKYNRQRYSADMLSLYASLGVQLTTTSRGITPEV